MNNLLNYNPRSEWERWTGNHKCPNCGGDEIEYNTRITLASYPPQSQLRCKNCGHYFSSGIQAEWDDNDALNKLWEHDQSILNTPEVGDWPTPCDPPSYPDIYVPDQNSKVGWICPKCGSCLAPHVVSCPYCSAPTTINITY